MNDPRHGNIESGGRPARSVLDCGGPLPLRSARALAQSKTWRLIGTPMLLCIALASARAQNYSLDWHTIDGGGGTSAGGGFSITGTIGQPDAGGISGGGYSLAGGFWSVVQTPGAPLLTIRLASGNSVIVSWPSPSTGFALQQTTGLNPANWTTPAQTATDNGTNKFIIVNPPTGNRFYRLFKP